MTYEWRSEQEERDAVVAEAMTWLRTPYHHRARLKGVGADCAQFPAAVYEHVGIIDHIDPDYPQQWHVHRSEERYLGWVRRYAHPVREEDVLPGDFGVWRWGKVFSHGGIVCGPEMLIHCYLNVGVVTDNYNQHEELRKRQRIFFSVWGGSRGRR